MVGPYMGFDMLLYAFVTVGHVSPEAADGGPIAAIKDGDIIKYDVPAKKLNVNLSDQEIQKRLKEWKQPEPKIKTGFLGRIYPFIVESADKVCRIRVGEEQVHYGGGLVDGTFNLKLFGDVATELAIRHD